MEWKETDREKIKSSHKINKLVYYIRICLLYVVDTEERHWRHCHQFNSVPNNSQRQRSETSNMVNLTEGRPGIAREMPRDGAWDTQTIGVATDAPEPQVVHKGQRLRSQWMQKLRVSDHAPSKNKNTTNRFSRIRVMNHTKIKNSRSSANITNKPHRISIGSYQATIISRERLLT